MIVMAVAFAQAAPGLPARHERHVPETPKIAECRFTQATTRFDSLKALPEPIRAEIARFFKNGGGLAEAGGEFNSTDVIDAHIPGARFIRAYHTQDTWFIWWERGGFVHSLLTLALTRTQEATSGPVFRVTPGSIFTGDLCAGSNAFLLGVRAAN
ncbi:hypothetical protein [uncultured Sphingomonas sp.]|uniref:hypothetical protein n=1 Tax=uncultured Sphingomonas sp. TaxID=158754 RepID=UPI0025EA2EC6|nr:hypothetical protein [uncultured Sphingomonas sp.]